MTYNHIFTSSRPRTDRLPDFGFAPDFSAETGGQIYVCEKPLSSGGFFARILLNISAAVFEVRVFDSATGERYALFDLPSAQGAFVGALREEIRGIVDDFCRACCDTVNLHEDYADFITGCFGVAPDFPWAESGQGADEAGKIRRKKAHADSAVFRCPNGKWFALLMSVSCKSLGLGDETQRIHVVNLKAAPEDIPLLIDNRSIFPAYHMNKSHWITVALTAATDFERLKTLTKKSYALVE